MEKTLIDLDGMHAIYDGHSIEFFKDIDYGNMTKTHRLYLSAKNLFKVVDSVDCNELKKFIDSDDGMPF